MATAGPNPSGTVANATGIGTVAWSNPTNAQTGTNDNTYAFALITTLGQVSNWLKCTNFGFSLPDGSTPTDVFVEYEGRDGNARCEVTSLSLVVGGTIQGTSNAPAGLWNGTEQYRGQTGTVTDWGVASLTAAQVNASDFGFAMSMTATGGNAGAPQVDRVRVTITYTEGGGAVNNQSMTLLGVGA